MTLGERIRELRTEAGMTQDELARAIGTSAAVVSQYETGHREPSLLRIREIAHALDVDFCAVLGCAGYSGEL